jgi:hypothetical protein
METPHQSPCVCLVTIHGDGFELPPKPNVPMSGYADMLHARLSAALGDTTGSSLLSDDPRTQRPTDEGEPSRPGVAGPIYVESLWPDPTTHLPSHEEGLKRLGMWRTRVGPHVLGDIDTDGAPLAQPGRRIAHVALVYSRLEGQGPQVGPALETAAKAVFSLGQYASVVGAVHLLFQDFATAFHHRTPDADLDLPLSLRVRGDIPTHWRPKRSLLPVGASTHSSGEPSDTPGAIFLQLQEDVATYVCLNVVRQRVRSFVRDALLRLIYREDVACIIVNAHSQGTVVAFDVLSQLSLVEARKVRWFITAGSPLRKYVDLFSWEREVGNLREMGLRPGAAETPGRDGKTHLPLRWTNFWDDRDPVADPLNPLRWDPGGRRASTKDDQRLYRWIDPITGTDAWIDVADEQVDNVAHSPDGGLKAHNYWDNESDFIAPLAQLLRREARDLLGVPSARDSALEEAEPIEGDLSSTRQLQQQR